MKIIEQSWDWVQKPELPLQLIEIAGRTCYKSEDKITKNSSEKFVKMLIKSGHLSVIEHANVSIRFITNRGVTHELVRHRLASFSQESTRYVKYLNMEFIKPVWFNTVSEISRKAWIDNMKMCESTYLELLKNHKWRPEQAREVLPNSLKTEIVVTANLRQWCHIFKLRCSQKAHPQIRELMIGCLEGFKKEIPIIFDDFSNL